MSEELRTLYINGSEVCKVEIDGRLVYDESQEEEDVVHSSI